jgi:hypothetical protein
MELIYQNFDGLDVSFQGAVPDYILHQLEEARQDAERSPLGKTPALIYIGKTKCLCMSHQLA